MHTRPRAPEPSAATDEQTTHTPVNRRQFLGRTLTGVGGAAAAGIGCRSTPGDTAADASEAPPAAFDFTRGSSALQPSSTVRSACQFCNSLCALDVDLKDGRIVDVRGVGADRVQQGELCVKAELMTELVYNPRRLRTPMRRVSGAKGSPASRFEAISWDDAYDIIARKLVAIRDEGEAHTFANKTSGRMPRGAGSVIGRFFALYGSPNAADVGPVCNDAGGNALAHTFGLGNFTNGFGIARPGRSRERAPLPALRDQPGRDASRHVRPPAPRESAGGRAIRW